MANTSNGTASAAETTVRSGNPPIVYSPGEEAVARKPVDGQSVVVSGDPVELTLVAFGRQRVATVDYSGDETSVAQLVSAEIKL